jgi:hypothetical protein
MNPLLRSTQIIDHFRPASTAVSADVVALDIALIEVPITDRTSLPAVWAAADEQIVPADDKGRLDDNGLRIGIIGGIPPSVFLQLLTSDRTNPSPHQCMNRAGEPRLLPLGEAHSQCQFRLACQGTPKPLNFEQAQCGLSITPRLRDGSIWLSIVPQIEHGRRALWPTGEGGTWGLHGQRPVERLSELKVEVPLPESDYLVIGSRDRADTVGPVLFASGGERPTQRLLVIRASRSGTPVGDPLTRADGGVPPLAVQAVRVRGTQWR